MRRIESGPSGAGQKSLDPRVACQFGWRRLGIAGRVGSEIAGNVAGGNPRQAEQTYTEVREVLTYSAAAGEYVVNGGMDVGGAAVIAKLIAHVKNHALGVRRDIFG